MTVSDVVVADRCRVKSPLASACSPGFRFSSIACRDSLDALLDVLDAAHDRADRRDHEQQQQRDRQGCNEKHHDRARARARVDRCRASCSRARYSLTTCADGLPMRGRSNRSRCTPAPRRLSLPQRRPSESACTSARTWSCSRSLDEHDRPVAPGVPVPQGARHQSRQPYAAADPLRARRHRHDRAWPGSERPALQAASSASTDATTTCSSFAAVGGGEAVVLPHMLRAPFAQLPDALQYQIVHEPRRLVIRVVLRPGGSPQTLTRIATGIRAALARRRRDRAPDRCRAVAESPASRAAQSLKLVKSV